MSDRWSIAWQGDRAVMPGVDLHPSAAFAELGPTTRSRGEIYRVAHEVEALARLARELTIAGPGCDPARAQRQLDKVRALVGPGAGDSEN